MKNDKTLDQVLELFVKVFLKMSWFFKKDLIHFVCISLGVEGYETLLLFGIVLFVFTYQYWQSKIENK